MDRIDYKHNKRIVIISFSVTFAICLILHAFFGYLNKGWIFCADGQSHYMIGRSLYFDHDLDFANELQLTTHPEHYGDTIRLTKTGKISNQMPVGYGLLAQPFFLLADIITKGSNYILQTALPYDGYRGVSGIVVPFATLIYGFIGIYLAYKILIMFFDKVIAALSINIIILSTSLLWYITGNVTMAHIHSFTALTALMYITIPFFRKDVSEIGILRYACIGALLALATMVRLQNAIFAIIPIVAMAQHLFRRKSDNTEESLKKLTGKISLGAFSAFVCFIPQMLYSKAVYGGYFTNSYAERFEGEISFNYLQPELVKTLFSTNHGLFLWNPITLISCIGMCLLFQRVKKDRLFLFLLTICFILTWYIVAAWLSAMANSFGNRGFDGSTLFFALGWAEILNRLWKRKKIVMSICIILVLWNIQLLMQQRYFGWLPQHGEVPYLQVFKNYEKLPGEWERIRKRYFF